MALNDARRGNRRKRIPFLASETRRVFQKCSSWTTPLSRESAGFCGSRKHIVAAASSRRCVANALRLEALSLPTFLCAVTSKTRRLTTKWSQMVAVGALRTYGWVMNESQLRRRRRSHTADRIASATASGVGKREVFPRFRRCASRPTATLFDAFGIKKLG